MTEIPDKNLEKRSSADVVYYGKTFHPYGRDWIEIGLRDYVPTEVIAKVILKNIPNSPLTDKNWDIQPKEKLVKILMYIYDKSSKEGKQRVEKWVYAHRFRRKAQTDYPFLKHLESFYMFLRTNQYYKIPISPDVATKVAAQLTLTGIESLSEVKSVLKSTICKTKEQWNVFDSLFNKWFDSTLKAYGGSTQTIKPSNYLKYENDPNISVEQALKKLRQVISSTAGEHIGALGGSGKEEDNQEEREEDENRSDNGNKESEKEEPEEKKEDGEHETKDDENQEQENEELLEELILSTLKSGPLHTDDLKNQVVTSAYVDIANK
jgi:hypothetical protein